MTRRNLKRGDYYREINAIAEEAAELCRKGDLTTEEELSEWVHEAIDGHEWVIYTHHAFDVLRSSENETAYIDNFGGDGLVVNGTMNWAGLVFEAMRADVEEALYNVECFDRHAPKFWVPQDEEEDD